MKNNYFGIFATSILLLNASNSFASNNITLDTIIVKGSKNKKTLTSFTEEESKYQLSKIAGGASVVTKSELKNNRAANFRDVFAFTPGVFAQTRYGEESRLSIRGAGLSRTFHLRGIKLLQDGVPINLADGAADFQEFDPFSYSHIEVYRGANALKFGANTLGGAINYVTPTGYNADKLNSQAMLGSFYTRRLGVLSGDVIGDYDYFASASNFFSRGNRDNSRHNNTRVFSNIGYKFDENLSTRFYYTFANINQQIPGNLTKLQAEATPERANALALSGNQARDYFLHRLVNKTSFKKDNLEINGGVFTNQKDLYHPIFQVIDQQTNDYGAFADSNIDYKILGLNNETTFGTNILSGRTIAKRFVNLNGVSQARTDDGLQKAKNLDLFFENRLSVKEDLDFILGSQAIFAKRELGDFFVSDGVRSSDKFYRGFSPKIGFLYQLNQSVSLFTNYSAAYEPPTFGELTQSLPGVSGLANIEAQRSRTLEFGSRGNFQNINWDASWYYSKVRDELMTYATSPTTSAVLNADDTIHEGVELALSAVLADNFFRENDKISTRLNYLHNNFRFDNDRQWNNNFIPGIPSDFVMFEARYDTGCGYYIAPNVEYTIEGFPADYANTLYTDNYFVANLTAGYEIDKNIEIFADARNLLNKNYIATSGAITSPTSTNQAIFTTAEGRSIFFGVNYKLN
ncbi:MAG: TonB-dependent receptor [Rickettsiales bacterium]|nr:TonB-dependent receptor [Rickettsiales bacterium]